MQIASPTSSARGLTARAEPAALVALMAIALLLPIVGGKPAPLGVPVLGLVAAASLALHATGMVLVYRADRCLNLAQVQLGAAAGVLFGLLVQGRPLLRGVQSVCPQCVTDPGSVALGVNYALALAITLLAAMGMARLVHAVVIRRLKASPPVVLTVATAFVVQLLAGLQGRLPRLLSTEEQRRQGQIGGVVTPPADFTWRVGGTVLHLADLLLLLAAAAAVGGLAYWLKRTTAGRDLRAASADAERAATLGIDAPRAAQRAWAFAGLLSGVAGILAAASLGVGSGGEGGLVAGPLVRILAVVVAARFLSLPLVALAALAVGQLDQAVTWVSGTATPLDGALVLIIGGLLLLQRRVRAGGDRDDQPWDAVRSPSSIPPVLRALPEVVRARSVLLSLAALVGVGLPWVLSPAQSGLASVAAVSAVVGLSTLVVTGWAGQVSLGQLAFAAVGAATAGATHLPLPFALIAGVGVGALVAAAVGVPALRLRGLEMAAVSLALALAVSATVLNPQSIGSIVGRVGGDGLPFIDLADPKVGWYVAVGFAAAAAAAVGSFRRSRLGRALVAARDDEATAQSFGLDIVKARLVGFAAAGGLAAAAGVVLAHLQGTVASESFTPTLGLTVFTTTVVGGLGTTAGPLLGFALLGFLSIGAVPGNVVSLLSGVGGLALLLVAPGGVVEVAVAARDAGLRRVARRRRLEVPGITRGTGTGTSPIAEVPSSDSRPEWPTYRLDDQWGIPEPVSVDDE